MAIYNTSPASQFPGYEQEMLNDQQTAFGRFLEQFNGKRNLQNYLLGNYPRFSDLFQSEVARDPFANMLNFMKGQNSSGYNPVKEYNTLSPQERGERPNSFIGRLRYVL